MKKIFENKKLIMVLIFLAVVLSTLKVNHSNLQITELGELKYPRVNLQIGKVTFRKQESKTILKLLIFGDVYSKDKKYSNQGELFDTNANTSKLIAPSNFSNKYNNLISFYQPGKFLNVKVVKESPDAKYGIEVYDCYTNTWKLLKTKPRARVSGDNMPIIKKVYYKKDFKNKKEKGKTLLLIGGGIDAKTKKPIKNIEFIDLDNDRYFKTINVGAENFVFETADFYERFEPDQLRKIYLFYGNNKSAPSNKVKELDMSNGKIKDLYNFTPIDSLENAYLLDGIDPNGATSLEEAYEYLLISKDNKIEIIDVKTKKNRLIKIPKKLINAKLIRVDYHPTGRFFFFEKNKKIYITTYLSYGNNSMNILGHFKLPKKTKYWLYAFSHKKIYLLTTDDETYKTKVIEIKTEKEIR